ncbi:MAG: hypothetical protein ACKVT2_10120 [Saprospiraceae bacterium]
MPTSNIPFTYAVRTNNTIHLYILMYSGSTRPQFPTEGTLIDNVLLFLIKPPEGTGSTKHFMHYPISPINFTEIHIGFTFNSGVKIKMIDVGSLYEDSQPTQSGHQAFDVPYSFTKKIDDDHFEVELVIFSINPVNFDCDHGPGTGIKDTKSVINTNGQTSTPEFTDKFEFKVDDYYTDPVGAYEVSVGNPPRRRSKTKNINHTQVPFPPRRRLKNP